MEMNHVILCIILEGNISQLLSTLAVGQWASGEGGLLQLQGHTDGTSAWYISAQKVPQIFGGKTEKLNSGILIFCGHNFNMNLLEKQSCL
jgi:hypothetical protein